MDHISTLEGSVRIHPNLSWRGAAYRGASWEVGNMRCPYCDLADTTERRERTELGYRRFRCRPCQREFNERTGTRFNHRCWGSMEQKTRLRTQATSSSASVGFRSGRNSPRC